MSIQDNQRALEAGIHTDLEGRMTYGGYLRLDQLLAAQQPASQPPHHDEMLFILQHQVSELWMKLVIHEMGAALVYLREDRVGRCQKTLARCKQVLRQLTEQWSVLETLTPSEYMEFRGTLGTSSGFQSLQYRTIEFLMGNKNAAMLKVFAHDPQGQAGLQAVLRQLTEMWSVLETLTPSEYMEFREILGPSSGFQSLQYRTVEFLMGNKNAAMLKVFAHDPEGQAALRKVLEAPSLYDEALRYLARHGHAVPAAQVERDWSQPHASDPALLPVFERISEDTGTHWAEYHLCEDLVDLETQFQLWRFRHMRTVMRIIGFRRGTGGSSGVGFLKQALELTFFPELFDVRTSIGPGR